jgi:hypothetical protein
VTSSLYGILEADGYDMNPLGFVPDLSMRGVDNSIEEEMTFSA